jgi:integrase
MSESNQVKIRAAGDDGRNAAAQGRPRLNRENVQEVSKHRKSAIKSKWPKSDARHWQGRIFRNSYTHQGERHETADWCVKLGHQGRRDTFNLYTPNAEAAAVRALKIYRVIMGAGWDAAIAEFKPDTKAAVKLETPEAASVATIGELITAATRLSSARKESLDTYAKALRRIATGVLAVRGGKSGPKQGTDAWRQMIDATPLDRITPASVLAWKNAFLKSAANPQERNSAAVTVNSLLRNSKALLSKRVRPFLEKEMVLPSTLWFESVPMEKEPSMRYHSTIDAGTILRAAMEELAPEQPEVFKALILTLICGLRRSEADAMQWAQVDLEAGTLEIMDTEHRALKSADSAGKIALDAEVVALLRGFKTKTVSPFILETPKLARAAFKEHKSRTYRCDATHTALIDWLRKNGVNGKRPMHTMRKEVGSVIASRDGIFAASRFLRHSDIRITSRLYADSKKPVSSGLGALLAPEGDNVVKRQFSKKADGGGGPETKNNITSTKQ